jgi:hypothetical protein
MSEEAREPEGMPRGTCPICFGDYAVKHGKMFRHGYKAPGRGTGYAPHVGRDCYAAGRFQPLEVSPVGTLWLIGAMSERLEALRADLSGLQDGTVKEIRVQVSGYPRREYAMATRELVESGQVRPLGVAPGWAAVVAHQIAVVNGEIRHTESDRKQAEEMLRSFWPDNNGMQTEGEA